MKLLVAKEIGYCYGVEDAIEDVVNVSLEDEEQKIYTYGSLIHNSDAILELEEKYNIKAIQDVEDMNGVGKLAIRAHGIAPRKLDSFIDRGIEVIDATCPFVKKTHKIAKNLMEKGYFIVILGKKKHPEVIGIAGHVEDQSIVIEKEEDLKKLKRKRKIGIVFQSTTTVSDFEDIILKIFNYSREVRIYTTICDVTIKRQKEAKKIAKEVDYMIIIGGKDSSNTMKLVKLCREQGVCSVQVEKAEEVEELDFSGVNLVGLTTGTSTPQKTIDEILKSIHKKSKVELVH